MSFFKHKRQSGFTIVELIISVAIFAFMTAFLVARYGTFNQGILLTNLAYDVALTLRNAQSYGLNVKSAPSGGKGYTEGTYEQIQQSYLYAYGVHFEGHSTGGTTASKEMIFFVDLNSDGNYDSDNNEMITRYALKNGSYFSKVCGKTVENPGEACQGSDNGPVDVLFKRPSPDALFWPSNVTYAEITVKAVNGETKKVVVRKTGQISVLQN